MSMLAEPKTKKRNNDIKSLSTKTPYNSDFASNLMQKFGWSKGNGLGKTQQGATVPIVPKVQQTLLGLGAEENSVKTQHYEKLENALEQINAKFAGHNETIKDSPAEDFVYTSALACRKKIPKNVNQLTEKDMGCIFGITNSDKKKKLEKIKEVEPIEEEEVAEDSNNSEFKTMPVSIKDYFSEKMKVLKAKQQEGILANKVDDSGDTLDHIPEMDFGVERSNFSFSYCSTPTISNKVIMESEGKKKKKQKLEESDGPLDYDSTPKGSKKNKKKKLDEMEEPVYIDLIPKVSKTSKRNKLEEIKDPVDCDSAAKVSKRSKKLKLEENEEPVDCDSVPKLFKKSKLRKNIEDSESKLNETPELKEIKTHANCEISKKKKKSKKCMNKSENDVTVNMSTCASFSVGLQQHTNSENENNNNHESCAKDEPRRKKMKTNLSDSYLMATANSPKNKLKAQKGKHSSLKNILDTDGSKTAMDDPIPNGIQARLADGIKVKRAVTLRAKKSFRNIKSEIDCFLNKFSKPAEPEIQNRISNMEKKLDTITECSSPSEVSAAELFEGSNVESIVGYPLHNYKF